MLVRQMIINQISNFKIITIIVIIIMVDLYSIKKIYKNYSQYFFYFSIKYYTLSVLTTRINIILYYRIIQKYILFAAKMYSY